MNAIVAFILRRPFFVYSFLALFLFIGIYGYFNIHKNLFPNSNRPEIALSIVSPSSSAKDIAANIAVPVEQELYTIDNIRRVYSSTIDEVTVIKAEFNYGKNLSQAATEVKNSFDRLRSKLPANILEPQIQQINDATDPIMVIAAHSQTMDLAAIAQLAQDSLKNELLRVEGVANVDVFGGYDNEIRIDIDKQKLNTHNLSFARVLQSLQAQNKDYAVGIVDDNTHRYLLKSSKNAQTVAEIKNLKIAPNISLDSIASVSVGHPKHQALYQGNGKDAIALSVQRGSNRPVVKTIENVENRLQTLRQKYPNITFAVTDTQKTTISQSTQNMIESLRNAIAMSMLVVFIFLASFRQILVVLATVPMVYISTVALMYLFGIEFNVITLTAVILALGLLLDDTVVVVENIQRHFQSLQKPIKKAVSEGTGEIMFADFTGTLTTLAAIFPILFVGGYPQTIFAPLISTLMLALLASYFISISFVPLISQKILAVEAAWINAAEKKLDGISSSLNGAIINFFTGAFTLALRSKTVAAGYLAALLILFVISAKVVMPLVGQELMPAMDNGTVKIEFDAKANTTISQTRELLSKIARHVKQSPHFVSSSASIGQQPGVLSIGSGGGVNSALMIVNYVNRFERDDDIWQIQQDLRAFMRTLEGIKSFRVSESGATAMASIKANIATTLQGSDIGRLYDKALEYESAMAKTQGIVDVAKSWEIDTAAYDITLDQNRLNFYGLNKQEVLTSVQTRLSGEAAGSLNLPNTQALTIRAKLRDGDIDSARKLEDLRIQTPKGTVSLAHLGTIETVYEPGTITRENMHYTIDILGVRQKEAISHLDENYRKQTEHIELPAGMEAVDSGDMSEFKNSSSRILKGVAMGIVLIYLVMVPIFNSIKVPLIVTLAIPLTVVGASWILLLFDYHSSMSAMVGFILLAGVIVNNSILLIYFAKERMQQGIGSVAAMLESIKLRTRPVIMTSLSISVGMMPVAFGWAIGLERLAPLGAVVVGGLIVGTLLTLVFIPLFFVWFFKKN